MQCVAACCSASTMRISSAHCKILQQTASYNRLHPHRRHTATKLRHSNTLKNSATLCNTLQHTETYDQLHPHCTARAPQLFLPVCMNAKVHMGVCVYTYKYKYRYVYVYMYIDEYIHIGMY